MQICGIIYRFYDDGADVFQERLKLLQAVLELFVDAYNAFGVAKMKYRENLHSKSRELPFSLLDFL